MKREQEPFDRTCMVCIWPSLPPDVTSFLYCPTFSTVSTVGVTGAGADVDSAWEPEKLEARKMLAVGAARREAAVPSVQCTLCWAAFRQPERWLKKTTSPA